MSEHPRPSPGEIGKNFEIQPSIVHRRLDASPEFIPSWLREGNIDELLQMRQEASPEELYRRLLKEGVVGPLSMALDMFFDERGEFSETLLRIQMQRAYLGEARDPFSVANKITLQLGILGQQVLQREQESDEETKEKLEKGWGIPRWGERKENWTKNKDESINLVEQKALFPEFRDSSLKEALSKLEKKAPKIAEMFLKMVEVIKFLRTLEVKGGERQESLALVLSNLAKDINVNELRRELLIHIPEEIMTGVAAYNFVLREKILEKGGFWEAEIEERDWILETKELLEEMGIEYPSTIIFLSDVLVGIGFPNFIPMVLAWADPVLNFEVDKAEAPGDWSSVFQHESLRPLADIFRMVGRVRLVDIPDATAYDLLFVDPRVPLPPGYVKFLALSSYDKYGGEALDLSSQKQFLEQSKRSGLARRFYGQFGSAIDWLARSIKKGEIDIKIDEQQTITSEDVRETVDYWLRVEPLPYRYNYAGVGDALSISASVKRNLFKGTFERWGISADRIEDRLRISSVIGPEFFFSALEEAAKSVAQGKKKVEDLEGVLFDEILGVSDIFDSEKEREEIKSQFKGKIKQLKEEVDDYKAKHASSLRLLKEADELLEREMITIFGEIAALYVVKHTPTEMLFFEGFPLWSQFIPLLNEIRELAIQEKKGEDWLRLGRRGLFKIQVELLKGRFGKLRSIDRSIVSNVQNSTSVIKELIKDEGITINRIDKLAEAGVLSNEEAEAAKWLYRNILKVMTRKPGELTDNRPEAVKERVIKVLEAWVGEDNLYDLAGEEGTKKVKSKLESAIDLISKRAVRRIEWWGRKIMKNERPSLSHWMTWPAIPLEVDGEPVPEALKITGNASEIPLKHISHLVDVIKSFGSSEKIGMWRFYPPGLGRNLTPFPEGWADERWGLEGIYFYFQPSEEVLRVVKNVFDPIKGYKSPDLAKEMIISYIFTPFALSVAPTNVPYFWLTGELDISGPQYNRLEKSGKGSEGVGALKKIKGAIDTTRGKKGDIISGPEVHKVGLIHPGFTELRGLGLEYTSSRISSIPYSLIEEKRPVMLPLDYRELQEIKIPRGIVGAQQGESSSEIPYYSLPRRVAVGLTTGLSTTFHQWLENGMLPKDFKPGLEFLDGKIRLKTPPLSFENLEVYVAPWYGIAEEAFIYLLLRTGKNIEQNEARTLVGKIRGKPEIWERWKRLKEILEQK